MNFNSGIKSISISSSTRKVYEELETIRPSHISFSLMLAMTADEYIKRHKDGEIKLDSFINNESISTPNISADIDKWIQYVSNIDVNDFIQLQQKITQIQNIVDERVGNNLY